MYVQRHQVPVDLSRTKNILTWNRKLFNVIGLWPQNIDNRIFYFFLVFLTVHLSLEYAELFRHVDHLDKIILNLPENITLTTIFIKLGTFKLNARRLNRVLEDIKDDYETDNYKTQEERLKYLKYNRMAKNFIKITMPMISVTAVMFYLIPVTGQLPTKFYAGNSSAFHAMPYQIRTFFDVTKMQTYVIVYACQLPIVPLVIFGYSGLDCLLVTLILHLCGQLSVLKYQTKNLMNDLEGYRHGISQFVVKHIRLIRLAKSIDEAFNMLLLFQFLGTTMVICLVGYNVISHSEAGERAYFLTYIMYCITMVVSLFSYCFIGECLINESISISDYLYSLNWYDIPPQQSKLLIMCISRTQNPLALTAGRIYVFSLQNFTNVMKTALAYLSMLRKFV